MSNESQMYVGIAIIGMVAKLPGANTIQQFWENLKNGVESITFFSDEVLLDRGIPGELLDNPNYVKASPVLEGVDLFDANFFGFSPKEAESLDPQHRLFIEGCSEALESSGYYGEGYAGKVGVYASVGLNQYLLQNLMGNQSFMETTNRHHLVFFSDKDFLATRVSYLLNLDGPSINVQTACSSSLVALHLACESIKNRECDMAIAGGISILLPQKQGYVYEPGGIVSPDGHCRAFDANAQGTVFGSGMGIVVLKHVEDAIEDGDNILAVVKATAINNDGSMKVGYTAPGNKGQKEVILNALDYAEFNPETIGYVETHGTGTVMGDPVEFSALNKVYSYYTDKKGFCGIGSVKTNIGHLDTAAGVSGLIKVVLALKNRQIPPSLGYEKPNPQIDFENSPFYVNSTLKEWPQGATPRRAAVSSFGIGGTNAHVILEEAPTLPEKVSSPALTDLIPLSAKSEQALETMAENLATCLEENPSLNLADVAYTLQEGRKCYAWRKAVSCQSREEVITSLRAVGIDQAMVEPEKNRPHVTFLFPGQSAQFINMGLDLYNRELIFKTVVDQCFSALPEPLNRELPGILFPKEGDEKAAKEKIDRTEYTQPTLFIIEYAMAQLLIAKGVKPDSMTGHSLGEYVAACVSGVFSLKDALLLIAERGRLIQSLPEGSMLAVTLSPEQAKPYLNDSIDIAAYNMKGRIVLAGPDDAINQLAERLKADKILSIKLQTSHAFHSSMMEPILEEYRQIVEKTTRNQPKIPFISNVTGDWITDEQSTDPAYWSQHIRGMVNFSQGMSTLLEKRREEAVILVEVGPGKTLTTFAQSHFEATESVKTVRTMRQLRESINDTLFFTGALASLWTQGINFDWKNIRGERCGKRVPLPTYPFERQSYWIEPDWESRQALPTETNQKEEKTPESLFHLPVWKKTELPALSQKEQQEKRQWLLFADEQGLAEALLTTLSEQGEPVVMVVEGEETKPLDQNHWSLNSKDSGAFRELLQALKKKEQLPTHMVHCRNFTESAFEFGQVAFNQFQEIGIRTLFYLIQAWGEVGGSAPLQIGVVANQLHKVIGKETVNPSKSTILSAGRVVPFEFSAVRCKTIDLDEDFLTSDEIQQSVRINNLIAEIKSADGKRDIAWRGTNRWELSFNTVGEFPVTDENFQFQTGGVYLVTGGMGALALSLIESVVRTTPAKFALLGRSAFPAKDEWQSWLEQKPKSDPTSLKIQQLQKLEMAGAEIMVLTAAINDKTATEKAVETVRSSWGRVNGILHAAGIPGKNMIQFSTMETVSEVLDPKTTGVQVLEAIFQHDAPDFMVLFSSVSSYFGGGGQFGYCAANAYLDAYSHSDSPLASKGTAVISINWPAWSEIGMAVTTAAANLANNTNKATLSEPVNHPLLEELQLDTPEKRVFRSTFSPEKDWVLDEHRIFGKALIAGVTYMEMVKAAWFHGNREQEQQEILIKNLFFLTPMIVDEKENREVYTVLVKEQSGYSFRIGSQLPAVTGEDPQWVEHAKGTIVTGSGGSEKQHDPKAIRARCGEEILIETGEQTPNDNWKKDASDHLISTGPRWNCAKKVYVGNNEGLVKLELPEAFRTDMESFQLHPALIDIATSISSNYISNQETLPFYYKKVTVRNRVPAEIYSHIKVKTEQDSEETLTLDLTIFDENGTELIEIEGFTKKKVKEGEFFSVENQKKRSTLSVESRELNDFYGTLFTSAKADYDASEFYSITPVEGAEAFRQILSQRDYSQLLVAPADFNKIRQEFDDLYIQDHSKVNEIATAPRKLYPRPNLPESYVMPESTVEKRIAEIWQNALGFEKVGVNDNFFDLGGDSLLAVNLINKVNQEMNTDISVVDLFDKPNIRSMASIPGLQNLAEEPDVQIKREKRVKPSSGNTTDIAIIGLAARYPGAKNVDQFWENLRDGADTLTTIKEDSDLFVDYPGFVNKSQKLNDIDLFDADFFGYTAKGAMTLSPQHRFFLETSWEALENAGYDPKGYDGRVGVFAGGGNNNYLYNLISDQHFMATLGPYQLESGNDLSYISSSVAYRLNLRGPAISVQTACSSSLVAMHYARTSLINDECDMALAGGVSIRIPENGYQYFEGGIYSPDGYVRTFDSNAKGTIFSSGVGIIVMKRLEEALQENDSIVAVIKGCAINNDGSQKAGFTAPSRSGQSSVILDAQANAGVIPDQIQYVETHGTATVIGDPIEVGALTQAFRTGTDQKQYCALGSVKTNIGHTDAAAGVAGVIKTALALKHEQLPPSLNFETPNPVIDFENSPFYVNAKLSDWKRSDIPRSAGVSSFGVGGTNAHLILQEAPELPVSDPVQGWVLLPLSARTETAANTMREDLAQFLEKNPQINLADVAYTLQVGRQTFDHRFIVVCQNHNEAVKQLRGEAVDWTPIAEKDPQWVSQWQPVAEQWLSGKSVDWATLSENSGRYRIPLPTYPFERKRYWVERKTFGSEPEQPVQNSASNLHGSPEVELLPRPELSVDYVAPETEIEKKMVTIWQEILGFESVGINDNFFELGGDSLVLVSIRSRVLSALGVEIDAELFFDHATPKELSARINSIETDDTATVKQKMEIPAASRDKELSLSFSQQRLWLIDQIHNDSRAYNLTVAFKVQGKLNADHLRESLKQLAQRQEVLRTTFMRNTEGEPTLNIAPTASIDLNLTDIQHLPENKREEKAKKILSEESVIPFDLETGLLFRTSLITLDKESQFLSLVIHHSIFDGWSIIVFVQELMAIYQGLENGETPFLTELPVQYADYAEWQRQQQTEEVLNERLNALTKQLSGADFMLNLPTDYPRPDEQSYKGAKEYFTLSEELLKKLNGFNQQEGVTLFMTLLAAFRTLLYRYSGQEDFLIGTAVANRQQEELEKLIGFFSNTLVLRTGLQGEDSFRELIQKVRKETLQTFNYQDFPFERLVESLQPERNLSRSPLFQTMFILHNFVPENQNPSALNLEPLELHNNSAEFELKLEVWEENAQLRCHLEYCTDLFAPERIKKMIDHFQILLHAVLENPDQSITNTALLTPAEQQQILLDWNQTERDFPKTSIHELIEKQAAINPNAIALRFDEQSMIYVDLNRKANRLAHYLIAQGVKADTLVGIHMERSLNMVISMLAVLKSGGAYVPMDPAYPVDRLLYMAKDADLKMVITDEALKDRLVFDQPVTLFLADQEESETVLSQYAVTNPVVQGDSKRLAYAIYTSGSTGNPKGVQIPQDALSNCLLSFQRILDVKQSDRLLAITTISFDISVLELFLPLISGATCCLAKRSETADSMALQLLLEQHEINLMQATPATWQILLDGGWKGNDHLTILCGGEALTTTLARQLGQCGKALWNVYGPTEATIWVSANKVETVSEREGIVPIGNLLDNTQFYILDERLNPVPIGVPGELHIAGRNLARGYRNLEKMTAEKFIANPFANNPEERLYKTGDLARWLPDGTPEFLGRIDHQVKIRGFRIELGEIESRLLELDSVRDAVVMAHGKVGEQRLVAYVIAENSANEGNADENGDPNGSEWAGMLKSELKNALPEYMVPAFFIKLDKFPLTPNGKVNRKALPKPDESLILSESKATFEAPKTELENRLLKFWKEILKLERISVTANFFDIGGHSLLVTRLISLIQKELKITLPLKSIFEATTIRDLAALLEQDNAELRRPQLPPIEPVEKTGPQPLSHAQSRLWFLDRLEGENGAYNIPTGLRMTGVVNPEALRNALTEITNRHESIRTVYTAEGGEGVQIINPPLDLFPLEIRDLTGVAPEAREEKVRELAKQEMETPFRLDRDLLLRATLLALEEEDHVLLLTMHHIASDGWSMGVLVKELVTLYQDFSANKNSTLPTLPVQYTDFVLWQKEWHNEQFLNKQIDYWKNNLEAAPTVHSLPLDRPRPAKQTFNGSVIHKNLDKPLADQLTGLSRQQGATLFMTLQTVFATLLSRYSNETDILLGSPIANRTRAEQEGIIGLFINTLVFRTDLSGNPSFTDLLDKVQKTALENYQNQDLPFEQLLEKLQVPRNLSHSPLFQIMIVLQNTEQKSIEIPGLTLSPINQDLTTSKFDLTLYLEEHEQGIMATWEYNTDLFDAETIERFANNYEILLRAVVENPSSKIADLKILGETEKEQLQQWNETAMRYPNATVHALFEQQATKTPETIAIRFEENQLTYSELEQKANQMAHYLIQQGIKPGSLIALCMNRSLEMEVALMAILKAGCAYVPLDPVYPKERLTTMLDDAEVKLLLTQKSLESLFESVTAPIVFREEVEAVIDTMATTAPVTTATADSLAYVIYTSGTTGKPKGVQITHRNLVNFIYSMKEKPGFTNQETLLSVTTICFDIFGLEFYMPLLFGGTHYLVSQEVAVNGKLLTTHLKKAGATIMQATPATWNLLLESGWKADRPFKALCGGEPLPRKLAELLAAQELVELWNMYGPTETTIWSSVERITGKENKITIGKAIGNTTIHILDDNLNPVPIGTVGEILIGGDGVSPGYYRRDSLTAEKFINDSCCANGSKIYKTGDLGRFLPDGRIECLGRKDRQVKLRGFRIELEEIESCMRKFSDIADGAVTLGKLPNGEPAIFAYPVFEGANDQKTESPLEKDNNQPAEVKSADQDETIAELRTYMREQLPEYMVPSGFYVLEALPLTPNGKIDRKALPALTQDNLTQASVKRPFVEPSGTIQKKLAVIFQSVLGVEKVSIHDNFFDIGGHSLLMMQALFGIEREFKIEFEADLFFTMPNIAEMATVIQERINDRWSDSIDSDLKPIEPSVESTEPFPLLPNRYYFFNRVRGAATEQDLNHWNVSEILSLPTAMVKQEVLSESIRLLLRHHESLRLRLNRDGANWFHHIAPEESSVPLIVEDLSNLPEELHRPRMAEMNAEYQRSLSLSDGMIKFIYYHCGNSENSYVQIIAHHLVIDAWSFQLLENDLITIYRYLVEGQDAKLPGRSSSIRDLAVGLHQYAQSEAIRDDFEWITSRPWQRLRSFQLDFPDQLEQNLIGSEVDSFVTLEKETVDKLRQQQVQNGNASFQDVILTLLLQSMSEWNNSETILTYLLAHGRMPKFMKGSFSGTVGYTINPVHAFFSVDQGVESKTLIDSIQKQHEENMKHAEYYGALRFLSEDPTIRKTMEQYPFPEMMINLLPDQMENGEETQSIIRPVGREFENFAKTWQSPNLASDCLIYIEAVLKNDRFEIMFRGSGNLFRQETMDAIAQKFTELTTNLLNS